MNPDDPIINPQQSDLNPIAEKVRRKLRQLELSQNGADPAKSETNTRNPTSFSKAKPRAVKLFVFLGAISLAVYFSGYHLSVFVEQITGLISSQTTKPDASQIKPTSIASFEVNNVMHKITRVDNGNILTITATLKNSGNGAGQVDSLIVTLYDKSDKALFSWPAPVTSDFIEASSSVPFETRIVEPPKGFASVRVQLD